MFGTVDQQAAEHGFQGLVLAYRLIQGESVPQLTNIETKLVTAKEAGR
jgi:ribose transport system substrate-binding protein